MRQIVAAWISGIAGIAILALLAGCTPITPQMQTSTPLQPPPPETASYKPASFADFKGWGDSDFVPTFTAFLQSCKKITALPAAQTYGPAALGMPVSAWQAACADAAKITAPDAVLIRHYFERNFRPLAVSFGGDPQGLFTGYYEPEIRASRTCGGQYKTPLYRRPPDIVTVNLGMFRKELADQQIVGKVHDGKLVPYPTRAAINNGALPRGLVLACAADPVDSFIVEIQGSGRLLLEDGRLQSIGYDGKNGQPYVAIGRELVRLGEMKIEDVTMPNIRAWLAAHPDRVKAILESNPSYVFFREISGKYAIGAQGVELTPGYSLAVDRRFLPLGAPVWLETDLPAVGLAQDGQALHRLMVAQDTGGAIRGAVRGDIFWGAGSEAEKLAGAMKQSGRYFILVPRGTAVALR